MPYWFIDGGMVVDQLLLAVTDAGLGACFFGLFEHEAAVQNDVRCAGRVAGHRHRRARSSGPRSTAVNPPTVLDGRCPISCIGDSGEPARR